jgi:hypothetical protein
MNLPAAKSAGLTNHRGAKIYGILYEREINRSNA